MASDCSARTLPLSERLRRHIDGGSLSASTVVLDRGVSVYSVGDRDMNLYLVESGQVKTMTVSRGGKECLLSIHSACDLLGEQCILGERAETATAMTRTVLKQIRHGDFLSALRDDGLLKAYLRALAARLRDQQQVIATMVLVDCERRLAATLLQLARRIGTRHQLGLCVPHPITQEELSQMVGTTRSRVGLFLRRFRDQGLIDVIARSLMVVDEDRLARYLDLWL